MERKALALVFISNLILSNSFASTVIEDLPKNEQDKYHSFSMQKQAEVLRRLQTMDNYDASRTHLDNTGRFFIIDDSLDKLVKENGLILPPNLSSPKNVISDNPPSGYTPEGIPIFHSFPGSTNVIYLNFLGGHLRGTAWNDFYGNPDYNTQRYVPVAYNPNQTPGFPPAVQNAIAAIWAKVAEDYAPWQIDVTTEAPRTYTITTLTALITNSTTIDGKPMPAKGAGGIAFLDIFGFSDGLYYSPALVYYDVLAGGNEDAVSEAVAHEIGHNFGLSHEGILNGSPYYQGAGSGEISWGCIMGAPYFKTVTKFCIGDYPNANNKEDQVAIITSQVPLRTPSAGVSLSTATPVTLTGGAFKFSGIIENYTTSNFFSLSNVAGTISVNATTYRAKMDTLGNNLCLALRLLNASGNVISSSSNPQSCSATLTTNNLPLGNYIIQVMPVGNSITPFSVYGSMGQYDLAGTATGNPIRLIPAFTTLALNSKMTFDANDTVRVLNGTPPYTFSANINSFSRTGNTFTYTASKPGMDTITVIDSKGNIANARVTVSYVDFGGMYGGSRLGNFNNPLTGTFGCPAGYTSQGVIGTSGIDYPLYYCYRMHVDGVPANFDFGGVYSGSGSGLRVNPVTGAGTCPIGYTSAQVFGENTHNPDYPVNFSYKVHNEAVPEAAPFAGMYGYGFSTNYNNPVTCNLTCPAGTTNTTMLGTNGVDYEFHLCFYPTSSLKLSPLYTNMALNNTMSFDVNDTARVSGGFPPYSYSTDLGAFVSSGNTYTYTASKPGLATIKVSDSKGNTATAKITVGYMDFGGMYGYGANGDFNNPITGNLGCPVGYNSQQVMGTPGVDYPLYYCYRMHTLGKSAEFDFGGMYSNSSTGLRSNPITGAGSCPVGYTSVQIYGGGSNAPDYSAYMCYKIHDESIEEAVHFGGMYAPAYRSNYNNPVTGSQSCSGGWRSAMMLGTSGIDYPLYFCY